jgi:(5-formylfuran-3-yl)methyl phosphate synthase
MTKMLISVRSVAEAMLAAGGGADFIDLKEPAAGALGGLPVPTITAVLAALRRSGSRLPVSATIGDLPMTALAAILAQVDAVAGCGVDYVKVGIERHAGAALVLRALAASGHAVVPVFIADRGVDAADLQLACGLGFPGLMVDTADKAAGSLFERMATHDLRAFVQAVRGAGALAGLAGALRLHHLRPLRELAPDFAGFRSAVCDGDRAGTLDVRRLHALALALHSAPPVLAAEADAPANA